MAASATTPMRRLLRLAALPVVGSAGLALAIPVVRAEAVPTPEGAKRTLVLAKDLPIYDDGRQSVEYRIVPVDTSGYLFQLVSVLRQNIWKLSDTLQGAVEKSKAAYKFAEKTEKDVVDFIRTEQGFYPRLGAVALAGLTGVVLARRGGVLRKVVYSGGLMGATLSVCYPYQTVKIAKTEYEALRSFWRDSVGGGVVDRVKDRMGGGTKAQEKVTSSEAPAIEVAPPANDDVAETAPSTDSTEPLGDVGMSDPEDKDLYSTRT